MQPERAVRTPALVALAATGAALTHALTFSGCNVDDAYISYRYALHLARGAGLVFNPGERVEGYTNFLWTVLAALSLRLHLPAPLVLPLVSLACFSALALVTVRGARSIAPDTTAPHPLAGLFAGLVVAASSGLAYHSFAGLETVPFALAWTLAALSAVRGRPWAFALSGAAAFLLRPEAGLLLGWGAVTFLLYSPAPRRDVLRAGTSLALALLVYLSWKVSYFGDVLPNTLRAKVPDRAFGLRYLLGWSTLAGGLVLVALWALPSMSRAARALLSLVALHTLAVVLEGGDWMFGHRLLPSLPCLAMALDAPRPLLPPPRWRLPRAAAALAALAALALWTAQNLRAGALIRDSNELLGAQDVSRASLAREPSPRRALRRPLRHRRLRLRRPHDAHRRPRRLTDRELASRPGASVASRSTIPGCAPATPTWCSPTRSRWLCPIAPNPGYGSSGRWSAAFWRCPPSPSATSPSASPASAVTTSCWSIVGSTATSLPLPGARCTSLPEALRRTVRWHPEMAAEQSPD
ncbi:MAG: hypothetical protein IPF99_28570 [Deltaproteobacteria bacterium]|nr:hypothetical protein [Deltaproteobacteria bacterium]